MIKIIKRKNEKGYLLIEILIALIVFSSALIGLFALQLNSYSASQSANYRSIATNYANDFLDKMRSNKESVINGNYLSVTAKNNNCRVANFNTKTATMATCTTTQMAQDDLFELQSLVESTLPQGSFHVCIDDQLAQGTPEEPNCSESGDNYVVKIFWKDSRSRLSETNDGFAQVVVGGVM